MDASMSQDQPIFRHPREASSAMSRQPKHASYQLSPLQMTNTRSPSPLPPTSTNSNMTRTSLRRPAHVATLEQPRQSVQILNISTPQSAHDIASARSSEWSDVHDSVGFFGATVEDHVSSNAVSQQPMSLHRQTSFERRDVPVFKTNQRGQEVPKVRGISESGRSTPSSKHGRTPTEKAPAGSSSKPASTPVSALSSPGRTTPTIHTLTSPLSTYTPDDPKSLWSASDVDTLRSPQLGSVRGPGSPLKSESYRLSIAQERPSSAQSVRPLLRSTLPPSQPPVNKRIPTHQRPPRLNMSAVKEAELRGSLTSLPDLIRRATRLASNLDRGKTASRLGLDGLLSPEKGHVRGDSSYSDVLFAFPAPASSVPASYRQPTPTTIWPADEKYVTPAAPRPPRHKQPHVQPARQCCGLSVRAFIIISILLFILTVAAVLIPIFLILLPKQRAAAADSLGNCPATFPCHNGGLSAVDNNACSCICVNRFTGSQCGIAADPNCITATLQDASRTYSSVSLGADIQPLPALAASDYKVQLNSTILLSLFSRYNFSCSAENSLVRFTLNKNTTKRDFLDILSTDQIASRFSTPLEDQSDLTHLKRDPPVKQVSIITSDSLNQQTSTTPTSSLVMPRAASATDNVQQSSTQTASTPTATQLSTAQAERQTTFAGIVVLYVFQNSRSPAVAVAAQQSLQQFFKAGESTSSNTSAEISLDGSATLTVDFESFTIS